MSVSRQSVDGLATEITFLYTSIAAANCLVVVAAVSAADSAHRCRSYGAASPARRYSPVVLDIARAFQVTLIKVKCCRDERFVKARRVNPKNFFGELKRRNVYRAAVAYGVVAWFLTQLTTQVFPFFEIPNSAVRFVIIALAVGFPIAMLLSWLYEQPENDLLIGDLALTNMGLGDKAAALALAERAIAANPIEKDAADGP